MRLMRYRRKNDVSINSQITVDKKANSYNTLNVIAGTRYILCPFCGHIEQIEIHFTMSATVKSYRHYSNFEALEIARIKPNIIMQCPECLATNENVAILDEKMGDIIVHLNSAGYKTTYSCDGHYGVKGAYIAFEEKIPDNIELLSKYWYVCKNSIRLVDGVGIEMATTMLHQLLNGELITESDIEKRSDNNEN